MSVFWFNMCIQKGYRIPNGKIRRNVSTKGAQSKSMVKFTCNEMAAPPGQFIALQATDALIFFCKSCQNIIFFENIEKALLSEI